MQPHEIRRLVEKFLNGQIAPEESKRLEDWYESFNDAEKPMLAAEESALRERMFSRIQASINGETSNKGASGQRRLRVISLLSSPVVRIAASVVLIVTVGVWAWKWQQQQRPVAEVAMQEVRTLRGQQRRVTLPDGSVVRLNAESKLRFPARFVSKSREVDLTGEAFFEVKRNPKMPFRVRTQSLTTQVLGTSFNIKAYTDEAAVAVTVLTGKVQVSTNADQDQQAVQLLPGQQAVWNTASHQLRKATVTNAQDYVAWRQGAMVFAQTPMREVIRQLQRRFDVTIRVTNPGIYHCELFGRFEPQALRNTLNVIGAATNTTYQVKGKEIIISGEGCP